MRAFLRIRTLANSTDTRRLRAPLTQAQIDRAPERDRLRLVMRRALAPLSFHPEARLQNPDRFFSNEELRR